MNYYVLKSEGRNIIYSNLLDEFHNLSTYIFGLDLLSLIKLWNLLSKLEFTTTVINQYVSTFPLSVSDVKNLRHNKRAFASDGVYTHT